MQAAAPFDISVYFPSKCIRRVIVKSIMPISSLRLSVIPKELPCALIFNGFLLDESKTFGYYQFKKDDIIIISNCESHDNKWMKISKFNENLNDMLKLISNKNIMNEVCRLKDLRFNKLELKPSKYIKVGLKFKLNSLNSECIANCNFDSFPNMNQRSICRPAPKSFPTIIPETMADKPFDEALTFIWDE